MVVPVSVPSLPEEVGWYSAGGVSLGKGGTDTASEAETGSMGWSSVMRGSAATSAVGSGATKSSAGARSLGPSFDVSGVVVVVEVSALLVELGWSSGDGIASCGGCSVVEALDEVGLYSAGGVSSCGGGKSCGRVCTRSLRSCEIVANRIGSWLDCSKSGRRQSCLDDRLCLVDVVTCSEVDRRCQAVWFRLLGIIDVVVWLRRRSVWCRWRSSLVGLSRGAPMVAGRY